MLRTCGLVALLALAVSLEAEGPNELSATERDQGFVRLFDGESLDGWDGDPRLWSVSDGAIVGSSDGINLEQNTFLVHDGSFADFVLRLDVRLRNGNSGIQFRSRRMPGPGWVVHGYQADFSDAGARSAWGNFYEEQGRGRGLMPTPDAGWHRARDIVRPGGWNSYEIRAVGDAIRLTLNGRVTFAGEDSRSPAGIVAIQLHSGVPMRVECRNVRIRRLGPRP